MGLAGILQLALTSMTLVWHKTLNGFCKIALAFLSGIAILDRSKDTSKLAQDEACESNAGHLQILSAATKYRLT